MEQEYDDKDSDWCDNHDNRQPQPIKKTRKKKTSSTTTTRTRRPAIFINGRHKCHYCDKRKKITGLNITGLLFLSVAKIII